MAGGDFLKYASGNYGIDEICDYLAIIEVNTKVIDNPARKKANAVVRGQDKTLAEAERDLATLIANPAISVAAKNTQLIPAAQRKITAARRNRDAAATARAAIPAKLPANLIDPDAEVALLRAGRRGLQMVLRLLAHNAEHWLSNHLNAYLVMTTSTAPSPARPSSAACPEPSPTPRPRSLSGSTRPAHPASPRPGPAHRRDQPHPARYPRRLPAHRLHLSADPSI